MKKKQTDKQNIRSRMQLSIRVSICLIYIIDTIKETDRIHIYLAWVHGALVIQ